MYVSRREVEGKEGKIKHLEEKHEGKYNIQVKENQDIPGPWIERFSNVNILVCTRLI